MDNVGVYSVKDFFADFANLGFGWVDEAARGIVYKIRFVVLEGNESFPFGSDINTVI